MPIKVLKASAGSGKTYTLANEYLDLLEKSLHSQILAVTFTNKATEEMKSRIVNELNDRLVKKGDPEAKEQLNKILHDYSHFNISTIDKFFQKVMRSMFRELGYSGVYDLILDKTLLLNEVVNEMRITLEQYPNAFKLLSDIASKKLKEGNDWSFSRTITDLSGYLWKEEFMNLTPEELECYNYPNVAEYLKKCEEKKAEIIGNWSILAQKVNDSFKVDADMKPKGRTAGYFTRINAFINKKEDSFSFTPTQFDSINSVIDDGKDPIKVVLTDKDYKKYAEVLTQDGFDVAFREFANSYTSNLKSYLSIKAIISYAVYLPVLVEIHGLVRNRLIERNELLLSDINHLLSGMIGDSDAPFIYEKIGTQIQHYLLDEFQDTSTMQWKNFIPLIEESVSSGKDNLVVGDIKQSIYRWRNSDWSILGTKIKDRFKHNVKESSLAYNWRSKQEIVNFNNIFFYKLKKHLNKNEISDAYAEYTQTIADDRKKKGGTEGGYVRWKFFKKPTKGVENQLKQSQLDCILNDINEVLAKGYSKNDMGILVRNNSTGIEVSKFLLENGINVVSSESLYISSHSDVKLLIFLLKSAVSRNSDLNKLILESLREISKEMEDAIRDAASRPLFEQVEKYIQILNLSDKADDVSYIQAFQDLVFDYSQKFSSDINAFLQWWDLEGVKKSVPGGSMVDAVNVMTIHKSKGLDFPVVLIPDCNWKLGSNDEIKWFKNELEFADKKLPLIPLRVSSKSLAGTIFEDEYNEEMINKEVDSANLLYVAMTRPRDMMFIYSLENGDSVYNWALASLKLSAPMGKGDDEETEFIYKLTRDTGDILLETEDDDFIVYSKGELTEKLIGAPAEEEKEESEEEENIQCECGYPSVDYRNSKVELRLQTENSLLQHKGNVLHGILQFVKTVADKDKAIRKAVRMGLISNSKMNKKSEEDNNESEVDYYKSELDRIFDNPNTKSWFDGTYPIVWNERTIISKALYRPDRIMEKDGELLVVDYKFGEVNEKYDDQLKNYIKLLKSMNKWSKVEGCIYYHNAKTIKNVRG